MRFDKIESFKIEDLLLDEGNYRFKSAENQADCVRKIYSINPAYFKGLLKSIAEDDIGELLLVYKDGKDNIVLDGNRRLAVMKVLSDDKYLPSESLSNTVEELRGTYPKDFSNIQAQVSSCKRVIMKTVYERHAGGKTGAARIAWNAYGAARFGYDQNIGDTKEWEFIALLTKIEETNPKVTKFIDSNKFSFETYRRIMRGAFKRDIISIDIFSERNKRIKSTANKKLLNDALTKTIKILQSMEGREISLSRKENFADPAAVDEFLNSFDLSPDAQRAMDAKGSSCESSDSHGGDSDQSSKESSDNKDSVCDKSEPINNNGGGNDAINSHITTYGVTKSAAIEKKLKELNVKKITGLYNSLCKVSLEQHGELMYVGAWTFFEVLAKLAGNINPETGDRKQEFVAFFNTKQRNWNITNKTSKSCGKCLKEIQSHGNDIKHEPIKTRVSALQLKNDFAVLEPLILAALTEAISLQKE